MTKNTKDVVNEVFATVESLWDEEVEFLQKLGRYPSTLGNETAIQEYIATFLQNDLRLEVEEMIPDPKQLGAHPGFSTPEWSYKGRPVVVGKYEAPGEKDGKSIILQGHIDVVSPEPMTKWSHDPWGSSIVGNKMYGRGIADMKSGVVAMIYALKAVREAGIILSNDVIIKTVIEEECTGNGALAAIEAGYRADAALIPEPLGQKGLIGQVGVIWVRIKVTGLGAHTERAEQSINAIVKSYIMVQALLDYEEAINSKENHPIFADHPHPLNVNIGKIHSGDWPSTVPSECIIEARVGFNPGIDPQDVKEELKTFLLAEAKKDPWLMENLPEITFYGFHAGGFVIDPDQEIFQILGEAHEITENKKLEFSTFTATTDARFYNLYYDIPSTCYGPTGGNLHAPDEWVDLESVKRVTKTYAAFLLKWCKYKE
ncbi:ArgE/DapE family deacylase [Cytobacillus kochii]|uniref:ArgE/DapE family deacylase n=1 Tax=Cytobacillus kochii TaxID=859143 RepID=UPI001CD1D743|nr:ArgE/DapE family deacylase [Cytobacillus kochii]MCA1026969.1 ArgE/DapE family deacylase [Cytobacillus kochii]MDM5209458.1 ArgE/DapE family deacylase [Cytobacillus kochii]